MAIACGSTTRPRHAAEVAAVRSHGNVIEQILFAELNLRDRIPDERYPARRYARRRLSVAAAGSQPPRMASTVVGWNVSAAARRFPLDHLATADHWRGSRRRCSHLVYSDGLASVSVFIEAAQPDRADARPGRVGAAFAYSGSRWPPGHGRWAKCRPRPVEAIATGRDQGGDRGNACGSRAKPRRAQPLEFHRALA